LQTAGSTWFTNTDGGQESLGRNQVLDRLPAGFCRQFAIIEPTISQRFFNDFYGNKLFLNTSYFLPKKLKIYSFNVYDFRGKRNYQPNQRVLFTQWKHPVVTSDEMRKRQMRTSFAGKW